jgi:flagellin-like hook-associated protein FlgL
MILNLKKTPNCLPRPKKDASIHERINVISDKSEGLRSKTHIGSKDRFLENISLAKARLEATRSTLNQLKDITIEVKEIAIKMMDENSKHAGRKQMTGEAEKLFVEILKKVFDQDLKRESFAWNHAITSPYRKEEGEMASPGEAFEAELEIEPGLSMKIDSIQANFLTRPLKIVGEDSDLNPGIDQNTLLSDLNQGRGVNLGLIRITNNGGDVSQDIDLHHAITVQDVTNAINSSGILGLSAGINVSQKGLKLTYVRSKESNSEQKFTITEAGGTTARDLGFLDHRYGEAVCQSGSLNGQDLNPILTEKTPVSLLKSGQGLTLGSIRIALGESQRVVDLSSASTIGELIDTINDSMPEVIASVNDSKKGISVESTVAGKSMVVNDGDDKRTARSLGILGSPDMSGALGFLMEALNNDDSEAASKSLEILNLSLQEILNLKAETGAKLKRLENIEKKLRDFQSDTPRLLSEVSATDVSRATAGLANQRSIFHTALERGAAMPQPTLLDFIR